MNSSSGMIDLGRLTSEIASIGPFIGLLIVLTGVIFIGWSLIELARLGSSRRAQSPTSFPMVLLLVGGVLAAGPGMLTSWTTNSVLGTNSAAEQARTSILAGDAISASGIGSSGSGWNSTQAISFGFTVVALVGLAGFFRGWILLTKLGKGGGGPGVSFGHAVTLIIGGILAINIPFTLSVLAGSMGAFFSHLLGSG